MGDPFSTPFRHRIVWPVVGNTCAGGYAPTSITYGGNKHIDAPYGPGDPLVEKNEVMATPHRARVNDAIVSRAAYRLAGVLAWLILKFFLLLSPTNNWAGQLLRETAQERLCIQLPRKVLLKKGGADNRHLCQVQHLHLSGKLECAYSDVSPLPCPNLGQSCFLVGREIQNRLPLPVGPLCGHLFGWWCAKFGKLKWLSPHKVPVNPRPKEFRFRWVTFSQFQQGCLDATR